MTENEAKDAIQALLGPASEASAYRMGSRCEVRGYDVGWDLGDRIWSGSGDSWEEAVEDLKDNMREFHRESGESDASDAARGFSLVELMLVVVVIGILAAIAIPAYSAMCDRAREAAVKSNMHAMQLAGEAFYVENDAEYGSVDAVMASDCAPHFSNPFTHGTGKGDAWESLRRCGDATSGTRGIVAQGGDAYGFWVHGVGAKGTEILVLKSGEVVMDSVDPAADPLPGPGVTQ